MTLTDTQRALLFGAAERSDHLVTLPPHLRGGAVKAVVAKLIAQAFVQEIAVEEDAPRGRKDGSDAPIGLKLTQAGLASIGAASEEGSGSSHDNADAQDASTPDQPIAHLAPREGSKQALIISLLRREQGATIDDLVAATGWLAHTTRAALTGLRKKGHALAKSRTDEGKTVYRIAPPGEAHGDEPGAGAAV